MIGQLAYLILQAAMEKMLEMAEADVTSGQPRQHCARLGPLAHHPLSGRHNRKRARSGNAKRRQRLTCQIFADGGTHHRPAIAEA